jgi:hypothetical protein
VKSVELVSAKSEVIAMQADGELHTARAEHSLELPWSMRSSRLQRKNTSDQRMS